MRYDREPRIRADIAAIIHKRLIANVSLIFSAIDRLGNDFRTGMRQSKKRRIRGIHMKKKSREVKLRIKAVPSGLLSVEPHWHHTQTYSKNFSPLADLVKSIEMVAIGVIIAARRSDRVVRPLYL